jgi:UDP-glucose 4-epimerase
LLTRGHKVTLYDRKQLPAAAQRSLADFGERLTVVQGEVMDTERIGALIAEGCDAIVLGAAITAGEHLERTATEGILQINVLAQIPILSTPLPTLRIARLHETAML